MTSKVNIDQDFVLQAFRDIANIARKMTSGNVSHNKAEIIFIADNAAKIIGEKKVWQ